MDLGLVEMFVQRMMEFEGWVTHVSQSSIQGITVDDVSTMVKDLEKMVPQKNAQVDCFGPDQEGTRDLADEDDGKHVFQK